MATDKTKVTSYMPPDLVRQLRVLAAMEGLSMSAYLEMLAKREVERAKRRGIQLDFPRGGEDQG